MNKNLQLKTAICVTNSIKIESKQKKTTFVLNIILHSKKDNYFKNKNTNGCEI